jgi:hypothetical protein
LRERGEELDRVSAGLSSALDELREYALKDRVEALGGRPYLASPPGGGTTLRAELPGC